MKITGGINKVCVLGEALERKIKSATKHGTAVGLSWQQAVTALELCIGVIIEDRIRRHPTKDVAKKLDEDGR